MQVIGLLTGCALSLINSTRRGVYYTKSALLSNANAELALKIKNLSERLARKSIADIIEQLSKQSITALDEADLKLAGKKAYLYFEFWGQPTASNAARLLAIKSAQSGRNVVLCDTTGRC